MNKLIIFGLLFITTFIIIIISYFMYFREKEKEKLFYTTNDCPEMKIIEDNWQTIAKEIPFFDIENIEKMKKRSRLAWNNNEGEKLAKNMKSEWIKGWQTDSKWFNFPLMYHGKVIDKSDIICSKTIEILKKIPSIQIVGYSILLPKSKLDVHTDEAGKKNNSMAYNLLLTENCANLYVKNEKYKHKLGKGVIFDSNNEHYADNEDNKIRVILYVEFCISK